MERGKRSNLTVEKSDKTLPQPGDQGQNQWLKIILTACTLVTKMTLYLSDLPTQTPKFLSYNHEGGKIIQIPRGGTLQYTVFLKMSSHQKQNLRNCHH